MKSTMPNMLLSLGVIAVVVAVLLAAVYNITLKPIQQAQIKAKVEALSQVLPDFTDNPIEAATAIGDCTVYPAHKDADFVGAAVEVATMSGFNGEIRLIVGFDDNGALSGYAVLTHSETPGLGAKMDEWFRSDTGSRSVLASTGELKVTADGGTIDAISGATITSRAFLSAINTARQAYNKYKEDQQ